MSWTCLRNNNKSVLTPDGRHFVGYWTLSVFLFQEPHHAY